MLETLHMLSLIFTTLLDLKLKRVVEPDQFTQPASDKRSSSSYLSDPRVQSLSTRPMGQSQPAIFIFVLPVHLGFLYF